MAAIKSGKKAIEVSSRVFDMFRSRTSFEGVRNLFKHQTFAIAVLDVGGDGWGGGRNIRSHEDDNFPPLHVLDLEQAEAVSCQ
jgi:hypothetical protein